MVPFLKYYHILLTSPVSSLGLRVTTAKFTGSTAEKFSGDIMEEVSFRIVRHCVCVFVCVCVCVWVCVGGWVEEISFSAAWHCQVGFIGHLSNT